MSGPRFAYIMGLAIGCASLAAVAIIGTNPWAHIAGMAVVALYVAVTAEP